MEGKIICFSTGEPGLAVCQYSHRSVDGHGVFTVTIPPSCVQMKRVCGGGECVQIQIFVNVSGRLYPLYLNTTKQRILYQPGLYIPGAGEDQGARSNQSSKPDYT